jgi:uncharacterized ion transporter superfamily protein YfcC
MCVYVCTCDMRCARMRVCVRVCVCACMYLFIYTYISCVCASASTCVYTKQGEYTRYLALYKRDRAHACERTHRRTCVCAHVFKS